MIQCLFFFESSTSLDVLNTWLVLKSVPEKFTDLNLYFHKFIVENFKIEISYTFYQFVSKLYFELKRIGR